MNEGRTQLLRCAQCGYLGPQHVRSWFAWWQILLIYVPLGRLIARSVMSGGVTVCPSCGARRLVPEHGSLSPEALAIWRKAEEAEDRRIARHQKIAYVGLGCIIALAVGLAIALPPRSARYEPPARQAAPVRPRQAEPRPSLGARPMRDDPLLGTTINGMLLVRERRADEGIYAVYVAEHVAMKRRVLLRTPLPQHAASAAAITRLYRDARNAPTALDVGQTEDGLVYYTTRLPGEQ